MANPNNELDFVFKDWLNLLQEYQKDIKKDMETIKKHKNEIQAIKKEIYDRFNMGYFLRDNKRIVISAPEIIIGNVDKSGQLINEVSTVVIRSQTVSLEGVGQSGCIKNLATQIDQRAIDPGCDGLEEIVYPQAKITTQARSVLIDSNDSKEVYTRDFLQHLTNPGVCIHTDSVLKIDASKSWTECSKNIDEKIDRLGNEMTALEAPIKEKMKHIEEVVKDLEDVLKKDNELVQTEAMANTNTMILDSLKLQMLDNSRYFFQSIDDFLRVAAKLAEKNRQKEALKKAKVTETKKEFEKESTGANILMNAERIKITNKDGDGVVKENESSLLQMLSKNIVIGSVNSDNEENIADGKITLTGDSILVQTNNKKAIGEDKKEWEMPTTGKVEINSKEIRISSLDFEQKKDDKEKKEKDLTKEGSIRIRAEKINMDGTNLEGKAMGEVTVNSGKIAIISADVDKEKREIQEIHKEGKLELATEKILIGKGENEKLVPDKIEAKVKTEFTLAQGDKATLKLSENTLEVKDEATKFSEGKITIDVESDFTKKIKVTAPIDADKMKINTLDVKTQLKAPNMSAQ